MTGPGSQLGLLGTKLADATDAQLIEIVRLIDQLPDRGVADRLLAPARSRLARLRPPRPIGLDRVLILPFEDLLVSPDACWPGRRRVARDILRPLLGLVLDGIDAGLARELKAQAAGKDMLSADTLLAIGGRLWPEAARLIAGNGHTGKSERADAAAQLAGIARLLSVASQLVPILWSLPPKPMLSLPASAVTALAPVIAAAQQQDVEAVLWVLEILLARSMAADLVLDLVRGPALKLGQHERATCIEQIMRGRLTDMRCSVERLQHADTGLTGSVVDGLVQLVADLDALDGTAAKPADQLVLKEVRKTASKVLAHQLDRAAGQEILGRFGALTQPDAADDELVEQLEDMARSVNRLGILGVRLGLAETPATMLQPYLADYRRGVLAQAQCMIQSPSRSVRPLPLDQIRIVEILFGPDAAMALINEIRIGGPVAAAG